MTIIKANKAGFCFGIKRAVDIAFETAEKQDNIESYGQLLHNDQVTNRLKEKGVSVIGDLNDSKSDTLIIRAHGVKSSIIDEANTKGLEVIDCTCPYVKKVHRIVKKYDNLGYTIVIVGDEKHPEVIGIRGWCRFSLVINSLEDCKNLQPAKYCFVAQTTLNQGLWADIEAEYTSNTDVIFFNTICLATKERQDAATELAKKVDCMIVIGGYHSSNTIKLYEICKKICKNTYHIEKKSDLVVTNVKKCDTIGITAGASTPKWIIDDVNDQLIQWQKDV